MRSIAAHRSLKVPTAQKTLDGPTHEEISARAFERYLERGAADGADLDDWLQAERELLGQRVDALDTKRGGWNEDVASE
jgi:hypothetical protein